MRLTSITDNMISIQSFFPPDANHFPHPLLSSNLLSFRRITPASRHHHHFLATFRYLFYTRFDLRVSVWHGNAETRAKRILFFFFFLDKFIASLTITSLLTFSSVCGVSTPPENIIHGVSKIKGHAEETICPVWLHLKPSPEQRRSPQRLSKSP